VNGREGKKTKKSNSTNRIKTGGWELGRDGGSAQLKIAKAGRAAVSGGEGIRLRTRNGCKAEKMIKCEGEKGNRRFVMRKKKR